MPAGFSVADIVDEVIRRYPCCSAWTVPVDRLYERERQYFLALPHPPSAAIVVGHHIATLSEWTWYENADGSHHCAADDHVLSVCGEIQTALVSRGFWATILPYPGECGVQFRSVAESAGAGEIGTNAFLLHPRWGPWIQLRVMATDAPSPPPVTVRHTDACDRCGACISACPAGAIRAESFDGLRCRAFRADRGEYHPVGPQKEFRYCLACAEVCLKGEKPQQG